MIPEGIGLKTYVCLILYHSMPYPGPGIPPSITATLTTPQQKGPVIGPQVPNTKPLFPAAQVSSFVLV